MVFSRLYQVDNESEPLQSSFGVLGSSPVFMKGTSHFDLGIDVVRLSFFSLTFVHFGKEFLL